MRTFAQKMNQPQPESSLHSIQHTQRTIGNQAEQMLPQANAEGRQAGSGIFGTTRFAHDFSRIPVSAKAHIFGEISAPHSGHDFSRVRVHRNEPGSDGLANVHRSTIHRDRFGSGKTNRRFENFAITARDLSDPDIIARLNALSKVGLIEYRKKVKDLAVSEYITNLIDKMPALPPCSTEEAKETSKQAEAARVASLPLVADAVKALGGVANSALLCAFASNFNTPGDAPEFQTRRLIVAKRLAALSTVMKTAVPFSCVPADDTVCMRPGKGDTVAYVVGHKPPIKLCPTFRSLADDVTSVQSAIITHEYAHLVGSIDDSGGYAEPGAQFGTCAVNTKFKAQGDVLINTADALTGFVMHIGLGLTPPASTSGPPATAAAAEKTGTAEAARSQTDRDGSAAV